ncbi:hypothetical protein [Streptomyces sp. NPDC085540]|uniref:hypothetical protein n=1 Tax=Streptomyces sp. NPDC085540 TaxID=3365730 RepID=UPI0037D78237
MPPATWGRARAGGVWPFRQDPVHPEPTPSRGRRPEEMERRREEDLLRDERDQHDHDF